MSKTINQYNFFRLVKVNDQGALEIRLENVIPPKEKTIDQYKAYLQFELDEDNRLKVTDNGS